MLGIDQNCNPLWDTIPKLHAAALHGPIAQTIEDIDVAFTEIGAGVNTPDLHLVRERYHRGGHSDWGAALFYSEFLGRVPLDAARLGNLVGMKTRTLARKLNTSIDDLYRRYAVSDNWQLIGSSFVGDRNHHRTIGDLTVREVEPFLRELTFKARADMDARFPEAEPRKRIAGWFAAEESRLDDLIDRHRDGRLVDLYRDWMRAHLGESVRLSLTSDLFACRCDNPMLSMVDTFIRHYDRAAACYNRAVRETRLGLAPLNTDAGELPFFAAFEYEGRQVRSGVRLDGDKLVIADRDIPLAGDLRCPTEALCRAGIASLSGKAIVLVVQVRLKPGGQPLVLPYHGSLYTPAADRFVESMMEEGLLDGPLHPIRRVRFRLLDRMKDLDTRIRLPEHLARAFGADELPASELSRRYPEVMRQARSRLEALGDEHRHDATVASLFPDLTKRIDELRAHQRKRHEEGAAFEETNRIWREVKAIRRRRLSALIEQAALDTQVAEMDTWDSRGAVLPWSIALGGEAFYRHVIEHAELYDEPGR